MNDKKRLLFVVEAMGGGVFTYIVSLANKLVEEYDLYIAYAVRKQTPKNYREYFDSRIHLIQVEHFSRSINPTKDILAARELINIKKKVKPDVIHLHSSKAGVLGRIVYQFSSIPMFYTPHGYSFLMEHAHPLKRKIFYFIEKILGISNCTTISCSQGEHIETCKITKMAELVNNGIDPTEINRYLEKIERNVSKTKTDNLAPYCVFTLGRIYNDLKKNELDEKVKYITSFGELIGKELKQEINNANLKEEFEKEMQVEQMYLEQLYADINDMERESVGLSDLGDFENRFLDMFYESDFVDCLKNLFKRINNYFSKLEDIAYFYAEELKHHMSTIKLEELSDFVEKWNDLMESLEETPVSNDIFGVQEIIDWVEEKVNSNDYSDIDFYLPDNIEYGDEITIYGLKKEEYSLKMDELDLCCENGGIDYLNMSLWCAGKKCASGYIEITYGFVDFEEGGGIGDACDEDISYHTGKVIEYIEGIVKDFEEHLNKELGIVDKIRKFFNIYFPEIDQ